MSDRLQTLEDLLPALPAAADQRRLGDRLTQAMLALREAAQQARRLAAVMRIAEAVGFGVTAEQKADLDELRGAAEDVADALEQADDPDSLRDAVYDYEKTLLPALAKLDRLVRIQWSAVVAQRFQPLVSFGELIAQIDGVAPLGRSLASCGRRAQEAGGTAEDLATEILTLLKELDQLQAQRAAAIGSGDVGAFLNALAERRATLSMITPEVHSWLQQNQALDRFNVTPA